MGRFGLLVAVCAAAGGCSSGTHGPLDSGAADRGDAAREDAASDRRGDVDREDAPVDGGGGDKVDASDADAPVSAFCDLATQAISPRAGR